MIILRLDGGLASQITRYAVAYALAKELNTELIIDISLCANHTSGYLLDSFQIDTRVKIIFSTQNLESFIEVDDIDGVPEIVRRSLVPYYHKESGKNPVYSDLSRTQILRDKGNIYLCGYFVDKEKFYAKYWDDIHRQFILKKKLEEVSLFKRVIQKRITIGVHIRRGDMLVVKWSENMQDDYYRAAIAYYKTKYPKCIFAVFSDDIEYAKKILGKDSAFYYVNFLGYDDVAITELICLSLCDHFIMSNSSGFARMAFTLHGGKDSTYTLQGKDGDNISHFRKSLERNFLSKRYQFNPEIILNNREIKYYKKRYRNNGKNNISHYQERLNKLLKISVTKQNCRKVLKEIGIISLNVYDRKEKEKLLYKKFLAYIQAEEWAFALQSAIRLYRNYRRNSIFKENLIRALRNTGFYEEAIVETVLLPESNRNKICSKYFDEQGKELLKKLSNPSRHFILVPLAKMENTRHVEELAALGMVLWHLGHKVTIISEPNTDIEYTHCPSGQEIINRHGVHYGMVQYWKSKMEADEIESFYQGQQENELIIISRSENYFIDKEKIGEKKLTYVFYDFSDIRCGERNAAEEKTQNTELLYEKADVVLTKEDIAGHKNQRVILWEDNDYQGICRRETKEWGLEHGGRLSVRQIYAAAAMLENL